MIIPGLTSVTFRNLAPQELIRLAATAGLESIEWGGDVHVPVGQIKHAELISRLTIEAGLKVGAYGTYYKLGQDRDNVTQFQEVLQTAKALGAPIIRIWAGDISSKDACTNDWENIIKETRLLADMAGQDVIYIAFEFHENTLNDTYKSSLKLLEEINHPFVKTFWQPIHGSGPEINGNGIDQILQWIIGVHIFHWWPTAENRLPLQSGAADWKVYFERLSGISRTIFGNLEFVQDDSEKHFFDDAHTLLQWTANQSIQEDSESMNGNLSRELLS